jgi:hypothetical protein
MHAESSESKAGLVFAILFAITLAGILLVVVYRRLVLQKRGWAQIVCCSGPFPGKRQNLSIQSDQIHFAAPFRDEPGSNLDDKDDLIL